MLFILGVIAFLQMTILPGSVVMIYSRFKPESKLQGIVYIFGTGLITNYIVVYVLTMFEVYGSPSMYLLFALETALLVYAWIKNGKQSHIPVYFTGWFERIKGFFNSNSTLYNVLFLIGLGFILLFFKTWASRFWEVFYQNDAVLSWNRWALDWYGNHFPIDTWFYPQLLSTNWSMAYHIMQNPDIQLIPRNIMGFFPIAMAFLFLDLGIRKKNSMYFTALIIYSMVIRYLFSAEFLTDGYTEIPVTFFAFLSFYVLHRLDSPFQFKTIDAYLSIAFAAAAAGTKQAGVYILVFIICWNVVLFIKNKAVFPKRTILKVTGVILLIISVIALSWYLNRVYNIMYGFEKPGIKVVTQDVHQGRTYLERVSFGFQRILHAQDNPGSTVLPLILLLSFFLLCSLFYKRSRYITLFIIVPFIALWAFFFSYDVRNISMAIPFIGFSGAAGSHLFISRLFEWMKKIPQFRFPVWLIVVSFVACLVLLNFTVFNQKRMVDSQIKQQRKIGILALNEKLYDFYEKHGFEGKVFSKYTYFRFLPGLKNYWALDRTSQGVCYFLEDYSVTNKEILRDIKIKIKEGKYKVLFTVNQYKLIQVKQKGDN